MLRRAVDNSIDRLVAGKVAANRRFDEESILVSRPRERVHLCRSIVRSRWNRETLLRKSTVRSKRNHETFPHKSAVREV